MHNLYLLRSLAKFVFSWSVKKCINLTIIYKTQHTMFHPPWSLIFKKDQNIMQNIPCPTSFGSYSAKHVVISSINNCTSLSIKSKIEPTHGMNNYIELILVLCWGSSSVLLFVAQYWEAFSTVAIHACGCFLLTWHPDLRRMWFQW